MTLGVEVRARGSGPRSFFESRVRESEFYVQLALLDGGRVVAVSVGKFWQLPPIYFWYCGGCVFFCQLLPHYSLIASLSGSTMPSREARALLRSESGQTQSSTVVYYEQWVKLYYTHTFFINDDLMPRLSRKSFPYPFPLIQFSGVLHLTFKYFIHLYTIANE